MEARRRQVEAIEGKQKPWKGSRSHGRGAEAVEAIEEEQKPWKKIRSCGRGQKRLGKD